MSDGDAEEAFDHLRGEVALLRRAIEGLLADPVKIPPEVSRQLRAQSAELKRLAEETQRLAESPGLSLSPAAFPEFVRRTSASVTERLEAPWNKHLADLERVGAQLAGLAGQVRTAEEQALQIGVTAGLTAILTLSAWLSLSGPVARALPERWQVAERMAAATLDLDRLQAGQRLLSRADPEAWLELGRARDLVGLNAKALAGCAERKSAQRSHSACLVELPESWLGSRK